MPKTEAQKWSDNFTQEYPEQLPDRLRWLCEKLDLSPKVILRLMHVPENEVKSPTEVNWPKIVEHHEDEAWDAHERLFDLLGLFHFNTNYLKEHLKERRNNGYQTSRERMLFDQLLAQGPETLPDVLAYLSKTSLKKNQLGK